jgi:flagellar biosynthesis/type III secretory pathway protein FliH
MTRWSETIQFFSSPADIRLATPRLTMEQELQVIEREKTSFEAGRAEGERALRNQLVQQRSELQSLQQGVLANLQNAIPALVHEAEGYLVNLAFEIAQKLVGELPITVSMVELAIREGLTRVEHQCEIEIVLNPNDLALLEKGNSSFLSHELSEKRIKITPSGTVSPGGCIVQTDFGIIDVQREAKLATIRASLEDAI